MSLRVDAAIAGGGIIGLSLGLELLGRGLSVAVVERGRSMHGASRAAAGMLAVHDPQNPPELLPLAFRKRLLPTLISFAIGTIPEVALLDRLPHALQTPGMRDGRAVATAVLSGLLLFFLLEKMVLWRHCNTEKCETHALTSSAAEHWPPLT